MIIGQFRQSENDSFVGDIVTLSFEKRGVTFLPTDKRGDKEPDYRIVAPVEDGHVELGAAWKRTSEKGQDFISVSLDGPLLSAPFNAALFADGKGFASLVWNRPKAKPAPAKPEKAKKAA